VKVNQRNLKKCFPTITAADALLLTRLVNGTIDPEEHPEGYRRLSECYYRPTDEDMILNIANKILGGYGVEGCEYAEGFCIRNDDFMSWVNFGDTYFTTIIWTPDRGFEITSWGDAYENSPKYQEQANEESEGA
jgi:hypothetical protein